MDTLGLVKGESDLFEVAGCITRLVMWPTDYLWNLIDEVYAKHYREVLEESPEDIIKLIDKEKHPENYEEDDETTGKVKKNGKNKKTKTKATKEEKKKLKKLLKKNEKKLINYILLDILKPNSSISTKVEETSTSSKTSISSDDTSFSAVIPALPYTLQSNPPFQIGLHIRCGDYWSYKNLKLNSDGYHRTGCIYDEEDEKKDEPEPYTVDPTKAKRSYYLNTGNPKILGQCASHLVQQRQNTLSLLSKRLVSSFCFVFHSFPHFLTFLFFFFVFSLS
jgi:succinate dehydrogenase flavin-adding protein (antitoxin of CptAB toxin-antitoxin module)